MEASWRVPDPDEMPTALDAWRCSSLNQLFAGSFAHFAELPAFEHLGTAITYAELERVSRAFAAFLRDSGLQRGDRVALILLL